MLRHLSSVFSGRLDDKTRAGIGMALGMFMGLTPWGSILVPFAATAALWFRAKLLPLAISFSCWALIHLFAGTFLHKLGALVLTHELLIRVWSAIYQLPIVPWTRFNNTQVMGALFTSALLAYPMFVIGGWVDRPEILKLTPRLLTFVRTRLFRRVPAA